MTGAIHLRLVDRARNRSRFYGVRECETLFGELCLHITWGRIGRDGKERTEIFATESDRIKRRDVLVRLRQNHGYKPSGVSHADSQ